METELTLTLILTLALALALTLALTLSLTWLPSTGAGSHWSRTKSECAGVGRKKREMFFDCVFELADVWSTA